MIPKIKKPFMKEPNKTGFILDISDLFLCITKEDIKNKKSAHSPVSEECRKSDQKLSCYIQPHRDEPQ
jgi:hypothetical protein